MTMDDKHEGYRYRALTTAVFIEQVGREDLGQLSRVIRQLCVVCSVPVRKPRANKSWPR